MLPFIPSLLTLLLLAGPALLIPTTFQELQVRGPRMPRDTKQDSIKVVISEGWATQGDSSDVSQGGKEIDLVPGSPLVLTHKIKLVPSGLGPGSCGCEVDFAALRERLERLEREVSTLREKCGGAEGGCCTSKESKGAGCSIKPGIDGCPNECSDQGRCVSGRCVCFAGFSGPDCSESNCPGNCNGNGKCVNGQCVCDPGFTSPDCSKKACPSDCNDRGKCVNGKCVCDSGYTGPDCSDKSCPGNCNKRGRCINGQCVCNQGFTSPDCSKKACPSDCNDRGQCVNGKCVCDSGHTGPDCSDKSCPGNCNKRGRCINGQCVCNQGFTGPDCSKKACPSDCNDRGQCVNGKCVCNSGYTGPDCSDKSCPGNCNKRGRCINGQCVCNQGFTGPDCSKKACPSDCNDHGQCVNGKCVCDSGYTGADCSEIACPGNCNNRGHCIDGRCVCDDGFGGPDCSERTCPNDCNDHGKCVNGKCVCESGFTSDDCSEKSCPGNCNNSGRCINGQCICDDGFTGNDCSEKACLNNCSNHGKCVNGGCVCNVGFAGSDCSTKSCPNNCNDKGRCVKGECLCRHGFTGQDCSQCQEGMTGRNCDTVMTGVSQLNTRDITETSVTVVWTPPPVQYNTYRITFTSEKESDQQITDQMEGNLTAFTQTGLAASQEYKVTISGEINGRWGPEVSTQFITVLSGPTNLQVVKTSSTSAVVQWEKPQGEIDRYRLTVKPSDGAGRSQEMSIPADQDSAHIQQLEAGRLYDIILVTERGTRQSKPVTTQAVPGNTLPRFTTAALTMQVTVAPGHHVGNWNQEFKPSLELQDFDQQGRREEERDADSVKVRGIDGPKKESSPSATAATKPLVSRTTVTRPKLSGRFTLPRKPGPFHLNTTRVAPGLRKVSPHLLNKPQMGRNKKAPIVLQKPKPGPSKIGNRIIASTLKEPSTVRSGTDRRDDKNPAVMSGTDSETKRQSSSEEPKEQPDVGMEGQGNNTAPGYSEPTGTLQSQDKKCLNKIKVTHIRLPHKDRGSGCKGDGTVLEGNKLGSVRHSFETDGTPPSDLKPSSSEKDLDSSPYPLNKLLKDTFDSLNITTFSVHLSKPSNLSVDSDTVTNQILTGLKQLPSLSSSSSSSSSPPQSLATPSSSLPSSSSSRSLASHSQVSSSSAAAPSSSPSLSLSSLSLLTPSSVPSLSHPSSPSSSSSDNSDSVGSNELDVRNSKRITATASQEERKQPPSGEGVTPLLRHTPRKRVFIHHLRPNYGSLQNKTHLNRRVPHRSPYHLNAIPRRVTGTRRASTNVSSSSSASEESFSVEIKTPVRDESGDEDRTATPASNGVGQNQTEKGQIPVRRPPPKGTYVHRTFQNMRPPHSQTRPNLRLLTQNTRPFNPETEKQKEQISPAELPVTTYPPVSKDSNLAEGTEPVGEENEDRPGLRISTTNQTLRGNGGASSYRPTSKVGYHYHPEQYHGPLQNKTHPHLRLPQQPHRGLMHKPFPIRKLNGGIGVTAGSQTSQLKDSTPEIPDKQSGERDVPRATQVVQIREAKELRTAEVIPDAQMYGYDTTVTQHSNKLEKKDSAPIKTTDPGEEETHTPDSNFDSDVQKQRVSAGKNTALRGRVRPLMKQQPSSDSRASTPVIYTRRQPPSRSITGQHHTQMRNSIRGNQRGEDPKTNHTAKRVFDSKTRQTSGAASKPPMGSDVSSVGVTREPLDYVGVTNRTSDGFTLTWDSPEGKYKNFVVSRKKVGKDERPKQKESKKDQERQQGHSERESGKKEEEERLQPTKEPESENRSINDENRVPESVATHTPKTQSITMVKPATESDKTFKEVVPGSARSFHFDDLPPQTEYTVTLLGKGPGLLSSLHKLVISTGPEPPTNIAFSKVTENSVTVSWTKPKRPISGFKVTYTNADDGEPVSVSLDSKDSTVDLSHLSPGSTYEVSVISIQGLDESDPIRDTVMTPPDPPTDLRAMNVTNTKALLLWRPALAAVDKYAIVYSSGTGSELRITVSGNAAEQQLSDLEGSTTYTVTITSMLGSVESSTATTSFTTTSGSERDSDGPADLRVNDVTPRTALVLWKPPSKPTGSYRLTYQAEGHPMKEVMVNASVREYNLTRLDPGSKYTVQLQAEGGEQPTAAVSTEFTTGTLRFPFPADCSQELLNGIRTSGEVEIFPKGRGGRPLMVYCDMETDGGGWTVFQRRKDGSVDFFRSWKEYSKGFGDLSGEFWLASTNMTTATRMSLRVDLRAEAESAFARYSRFEVARKDYRLTVGGYSGTAGDSLSYHNNEVFSTKDRDQSQSITRCAMSYRGGWWYKNCHEANLNGLYGVDVKHQGVIWTTWKGKDFSIPFAEMKMRPVSFSPPTRG